MARQNIRGLTSLLNKPLQQAQAPLINHVPRDDVCDQLSPGWFLDSILSPMSGTCGSHHASLHVILMYLHHSIRDLLLIMSCVVAIFALPPHPEGNFMRRNPLVSAIRACRLPHQCSGIHVADHLRSSTHGGPSGGS